MITYIIIAVVALLIGAFFGHVSSAERTWHEIFLQNEVDHQKREIQALRIKQLWNDDFRSKPLFIGMDFANDLSDSIAYSMTARDAIEKTKIRNTLRHTHDLAHANLGEVAAIRKTTDETLRILKNAINDGEEEKKPEDPRLCSKCQSARVDLKGGRCSDCV